MSELVVAVERLPHAKDLPLPARATAGSAGLDLLAAVPEGKPLVLAPGARARVPTGIRIALPDGFEAQVRPRSGLALAHGVTVLNAPGTVDSDYRGEIGVILANFGEAPFAVHRGMRIAQLVVAPVTRVRFAEGVIAPDSTARAGGGFGSTGVGDPRPLVAAYPPPAGETDAQTS